MTPKRRRDSSDVRRRSFNFQLRRFLSSRTSQKSIRTSTMMRSLAAVLLVVISLSASCQGKVYSRCKLAKELKCVYGFPQSSLANWVCLVQAASSFNTAAVGYYGAIASRPHKGYGLFQISDYFWCNSGTGMNGCSISCAKLKDNNIADDVKCARKIFGRQGFNAWPGWRNKCNGKNLSSYTRGCKLTC
ncbi:lysozyme c-1 [Hyalella azteca]|uniref:lysozyme n=1 Tax=Hyalella azteca TaxID=294128 RepID=A0A8B7NVS1_HYAAZ|nr:lysozyme c-1 [Hyalella azteca]